MIAISVAQNEMTRAELVAKEKIIERGIETFKGVGVALKEIRDRRGYRFEYKTFDEYCQMRWGWSRHAAYDYIEASTIREIVESTQQIGFTQAAELARLTHPSNGKGDKRKKEIDRAAVRKVASAIDFTKATVKQVKAAVDDEIKTRRKAQKTSELAAKAESFRLSPPAPSSLVAIYNRDARQLSKFVSRDVGLVFTSPPYNVGVEYNTHDDHMSEMDYCDFLGVVFRECFDVMCSGARIGVVVPFGIDRDPWKPFAAHIANVLNDVGFTLFGQVVWDKGEKIAAGRTSWGSYNSPTAPRFRDRTEAIVWGYKKVPNLDVPKNSSLIDGDLFRKLTQDVWQVSPATNANHPAVFPEQLVENAIRLFGYRGCHVLDPFAGIGTTGKVAKKLECRASLVELDAAYCAIATENLE